MIRISGFAVTLAAAGLFALNPALAQSAAGQGDTSSTASSQTGRPGSQSSATTSSQSDRMSQMGSDRNGITGSGQTNSRDRMSGQGNTADQSGTSSLSSSERKFLTQAAQGSMAKVELGKLAQEKASNDKVKQLGQKLVEDHSKALDEIRQIAQSKGVDLPQQVDSKHKSAYDRLSKLSGDQFDTAFAKEVNQEHKKDIKQFQQQAEKAKDPEVKDFASRTIPTLQEHHEMVQRDLAELTGSSGSNVRTDNATDTSSYGKKDKKSSATTGDTSSSSSSTTTNPK